MKRSKTLIVSCIVVVLVLAGSGFLAINSGQIPKPSAGIQDFGDWGTVTDQHTEIITTFWTNNPYPIDLTTGKILHLRYSLSLNGVTIAEGTRDRVDLPRGNTTQTQSTYLQNSRLKEWWVNFLRANETVHATANGRARIITPVKTWTYQTSTTHTQFENQTPILDSFSQAAQRTEGKYVRTQRLNIGPIRRNVTVGAEVQDAQARWGRVNQNQTTLLLRFRIHNPSKTIPIIVEPTGLRMRADVNGVRMFHSGRGVISANNTKQTLLLPGETREVIIPVTMDNDKVDEWFRSHAQNGERSTIAVHLQLVLDPLGIGTPIRVPSGNGITYRCHMQTAIFEDNQTAATTCG
ncbi:LEA type 2 family protein [Haladaptatus pallidirubidus]|uniref:LEA type 2 family protein n=1 Tax=Haladaptatus pallidirubidus TaxID=1008152 RepID=A0AAV3UPL4_9EURY|nr:LEA type 2 family protein [Haladaptatus pallidirubidus]